MEMWRTELDSMKVRELNARWMEQVNANPSLVATVKYEVSRQFGPPVESVAPALALPEAKAA
jgi:hypothetical protein